MLIEYTISENTELYQRFGIGNEYIEYQLINKKEED